VGSLDLLRRLLISDSGISSYFLPTEKNGEPSGSSLVALYPPGMVGRVAGRSFFPFLYYPAGWRLIPVSSSLWYWGKLGSPPNEEVSASQRRTGERGGLPLRARPLFLKEESSH